MSKRLRWLDVLRGFLILLVILGHVMQSFVADIENNRIWSIIHSFHIPAFMAISGYLMYKEGGLINHKQIFVRRIQQLLIPFLIWSLIKCAVHIVSWDQALNVFLHPDIFFWFLWALFWIQGIFLLVDWGARKLRVHPDIAVLCSALLLVCIMVAAECRTLGFQFVAYYYLFFSGGYVFHKYEAGLPKSGALLIPLTLLWAVLAWFWKMHSLPSFLQSVPVIPSSILLYTYRFLTAAIACYVLLAAAPALLNRPSRVSIFFVRFGQLSLGIYVVHMLLLGLVCKSLVASLGLGSLCLDVILSFLILSAVSYGIVYLLSRNRITARFLLGKL